jgi:hypothetical protein
MKKITTLFVVTYDGKGSNGVITDKIRPENLWVLMDADVKATQKFDGTAALIKEGALYKRYDAKPTKEAFKNHIDGTAWNVNDFRQVPDGAIPCQKPDLVTGHYPHWLPCSRERKEDKYFWEAFDSQSPLEDGTYELCGKKVGSNPENITGHQLIRHGSVLCDLKDYSFDSIKRFLSSTENNIEGIVFHHPDGRMCKIRKSDFCIKR